MVEEDAFGGGIANSDQITWIDSTNDEDGSIIPVLVAFAIAVVAMAAFFFKMTKSSKEDEEELY